MKSKATDLYAAHLCYVESSKVLLKRVSLDEQVEQVTTAFIGEDLKRCLPSEPKSTMPNKREYLPSIAGRHPTIEERPSAG